MDSWTAKSLALAVLLVATLPGLAQSPEQAVATANQQTQTPQTQTLKSEELDQLVAPIALYPDTLLAQVLMASTYPLEVVNAERWASTNKSLKGDQLKAAVDKQSWDQSVKSLVATPSVLEMMSSKLDWTQKLGDAVLAQQADVMDAIQRLRSKAHARNKLTTTKQQKVTVQQQEGRQVIAIEPTDPNTVYVPYYDPAVAYGDWPYPDYPPYYFGYPGYVGAGVIATGLAFGAGYALARWAWRGNFWGGGIGWGNNNIFVNRDITNIGNRWEHRPEHRHGVRYNNPQVAQRFGNNNLRGNAQQRLDFRGRGGEQVLRPGAGDRGQVADRGSRDRPNAGDRARGDRPAAGDRGRGDRANVADRGRGDRATARDRGGAGDRARAANRPAQRSAQRAGGQRDNAFGNVGSGRAANLHAQRGRASFASHGGGARFAGGGGNLGGLRMGGGGGGMRMGGGGGFRGGGGRRSDIALKHDITLLGHLDNGLGFYRFSYLGSRKAFVGVMAQEVRAVRPDAVTRDRDGYLLVDYGRLGLTFRTYQQWIAGGARLPDVNIAATERPAGRP
jgi:hypothetical protein